MIPALADLEALCLRSYAALRDDLATAYERERTSGDAACVEALGDLLAAARRYREFLELYPERLFETLYNATPPEGAARAVVESWREQFERRPGFRWIRARRALWAAPGARVLRSGGAVGAAALSPDGERVASGAHDGVVCVWSAESGCLLASALGLGWIEHVSWSADGTRVAVASRDSRVHVLDARTGEERLTLAPAGAWGVEYAGFTAGGRRVVSCGSHGGGTCVWDAATGALERVHRDGASALNGDRTRIVACAALRRLCVSGVGAGGESGGESGRESGGGASGERLIVALPSNSPPRPVFSPDGHTVACVIEEERVGLFDLRACAPGAAPAPRVTVRAWLYPSRPIAFSPDGGRIATICSDARVRLGDASSGAELRALDAPGSQSVFWSGDGRHVVLETAGPKAGSRVRAFDAASGAPRLDAPHNDLYALGPGALHPRGGRLLLVTPKSRLQVLDLEGGREVQGFAVPANAIRHASYDREGRRILGCPHIGPVTAWDAATGRKVLTVPLGPATSVYAAAWSPDGARILLALGDGTARIHDAATGGEVIVLRAEGQGASDAAWSPDGRRILTASEGEKTIRVWDAATGGQERLLEGAMGEWSPGGDAFSWAGEGRRVVVRDAETGEARATLDTPHGLPLAEGTSPDATRVIVLPRRGASGDARVLDVRTGAELFALERGDGLERAWFAAGGRRIVGVTAARAIRVFDAASGSLVRALEGPRTHASARARGAIDVSPDLSLLVVGGEDNAVHVVDLASGEARASFAGHASVISRVEVDPGARFVLSASWDGTLRVNSLGPPRLLGNDEPAFSVSASPDGRRVAATSARDTLLLDARTGATLARIRRVSSAPPTWSPDARTLALHYSSGGRRGRLDVAWLFDAGKGAPIGAVSSPEPGLRERLDVGRRREDSRPSTPAGKPNPPGPSAPPPASAQGERGAAYGFVIEGDATSVLAHPGGERIGLLPERLAETQPLAGSGGRAFAALTAEGLAAIYEVRDGSPPLARDTGADTAADAWDAEAGESVPAPAVALPAPPPPSPPPPLVRYVAPERCETCRAIGPTAYADREEGESLPLERLEALGASVLACPACGAFYEEGPDPDSAYLRRLVRLAPRAALGRLDAGAAVWTAARIEADALRERIDEIEAAAAAVRTGA